MEPRGGSRAAGKKLLIPSNAEASYFHRMTRMQRFFKTIKPCHVGIHWKALAEFSQMSTQMPGFQPFLGVLQHFVLAKLATIRIWMKACERTSLDARPQNLHTFSKVNPKYIQCTCPVGQARYNFHLPFSYNLQFLLARATGKAPMSRLAFHLGLHCCVLFQMFEHQHCNH